MRCRRKIGYRWYCLRECDVASRRLMLDERCIRYRVDIEVEESETPKG